jgi:hypothetical protein
MWWYTDIQDVRKVPVHLQEVKEVPYKRLMYGIPVKYSQAGGGVGGGHFQHRKCIHYNLLLTSAQGIFAHPVFTKRSYGMSRSQWLGL